MHRVLVLGTGKVTRKAAAALLDDLWASIDGDKRLILPITGEEMYETTTYAAQWAMGIGAPFELFAADAEIDEQVYEAALRLHEVEDPLDAAMSTLSVDDDLLLAWDDEDTDCLAALTLATKTGITARDLTIGLLEVVMEDDDSEQVEDESQDEPDEDDDDLPATMPLRDDDLKTSFEVFLSALTKHVFDEVVTRLAPVEQEAPKKATGRSSRRRTEKTDVRG